MSIYYSQTYSGVAPINATGAGTTKTELIDFIKVQLANAGWTVNSGSSGDWYLTSGTGHPAGFQVRIRIYAGTNCAQMAFYSLVGESPTWDTSATPRNHLLPNANTWRILACPYQFIVFQDGAPVARSVAGVTVPYVPSALYSGSPPILTRLGSMFGNAQSDTDATSRASYRSNIWNANGLTLFNGNRNNSVTASTGVISLEIRGVGTYGVRKWAGGSAPTELPLLCVLNDEATPVMARVGDLWDVWVLVGTAVVIDTILSYDSKSWRAMNNNNTSDYATPAWLNP